MTRNWTNCPVLGTSRSLTRCPLGGPGCKPPSPRWRRCDMPVSWLAGYAAEEGRRAWFQVRCRAAAVPAAYRDHAWRHEFEAVEEAQNLLPGVDVYLRGGVGRREVLSLGRVARTDGDDQVAAGSECPGEGESHA